MREAYARDRNELAHGKKCTEAGVLRQVFEAIAVHVVESPLVGPGSVLVLRKQQNGPRSRVEVPGGVVDVLVVDERHRASDLAQSHEAAEPTPDRNTPRSYQGFSRGRRIYDALHLQCRLSAKRWVPALLAEEELDLMDGHFTRQIFNVQRRIGRGTGRHFLQLLATPFDLFTSNLRLQTRIFGIPRYLFSLYSVYCRLGGSAEGGKRNSRRHSQG